MMTTTGDRRRGGRMLLAVLLLACFAPRASDAGELKTPELLPPTFFFRKRRKIMKSKYGGESTLCVSVCNDVGIIQLLTLPALNWNITTL